LCQFLWYGVYNPGNKSVKFDWLYLIGVDFMTGRMAIPFSLSETTPSPSSSHAKLESPSIWTSAEKNMDEMLTPSNKGLFHSKRSAFMTPW
jgi:hypothetical protein